MESQKAEDTIVSEKGHKLYCRYWNVDAAHKADNKSLENPRALIFVVHGLGEHCLWYTELATFLIDHGYFVFSHDHVGHGQSEGERSMIKDFDDYEKDTFTHIDAVKKKYPSAPVFLLSHSMGGAVAMLVGQARPDYFKGIVMIAPALIPDKKAMHPVMIWLGKMMAKVYPSFQAPKLDPYKMSRNRDIVKKYEDDPLNYHGGVKAGWGVAYLEAVEKIKVEMENVTWPFLILHGGQDGLCALDGSKMLYEKAKSEDKELKVFEDAYHQLHNELEPVKKETFDCIADWFNKRT